MFHANLAVVRDAETAQQVSEAASLDGPEQSPNEDRDEGDQLGVGHFDFLTKFFQLNVGPRIEPLIRSNITVRWQKISNVCQLFTTHFLEQITSNFFEINF